jgi:hypothetical protein
VTRCAADTVDPTRSQDIFGFRCAR